MPSPSNVVKAHLVDLVKTAVGVGVAAHFPGGTHTRRFADNLLASFPASQVDELKGQLAAGGGSELNPNENGKRRAHAPYSSAALAFNAFGRWLGDEPQLSVAGLTGFTGRLRVEGKAKIRHGGGTANLDVLLTGPGLTVGVESKLTETLSEHDPVPWATAYKTPEMRELLDEKWAPVLDACISKAWQPKHLGLEQIVKHVLGLNSQYPANTRRLVYVYWEPLNAENVDVVMKHRSELAELRHRVAEASTELHAVSYAELLDEWAGLDGPGWLPDHVERLRARYEFAI